MLKTFDWTQARRNHLIAIERAMRKGQIPEAEALVIRRQLQELRKTARPSVVRTLDRLFPDLEERTP